MKSKFLLTNCYHLFICCLTSSLLLAISLNTAAQEKRAIRGQVATCKIKVNESAAANNTPAQNATNLNSDNSVKGKTPSQKIKNYQPKLNQIGYFDRVIINHSMEMVSIDMAYPNGSAGEKVIIAALDGGQFDNGKKIKVAQLDNQKKLSFDFQVTDQPGLFRVTVKKGNDIKVVQLWVGPNPSLSSK